MNQEYFIKETLVNLGLLTTQQLEDIIKLQSESSRGIEDIFIERGVVANRQVIKSLIPQLGVMVLRDVQFAPSEELKNLFTKEFSSIHRILPESDAEDTISVLSDAPFNFLILDFFQSKFHKKIELKIIDEELFNSFFLSFFGAAETASDQSAQKSADLKGLSDTISSFDQAVGNGSEEDDAPIIRLVSLLIQQASRARASDIHIEPLEDKLRVRYRIDGVLHEMPSPPKRLQGSIISRLKIMGGMNIAEKRLPQDGRINIAIDNKELDLRVSTLPALYGESVVMRILDCSAFMLSFEDIGFQPEEIKEFEKIVSMPNGIFLVTGPTGSGKTTTLYAALSSINTPEKKLITVEDPVEYQIDGINQVQVRPDIGLTFAGGLRSMLRQAPDVILVGEIRDLETASIAIQSSLTGHLILSTLHTNDAPSAVTRLVDMGVKPYLVASTVQAVLAQRLVRKLCQNCKQEYKPSVEELEAIRESGVTDMPTVLYKGTGCDNCNDTGYKGRIGIFEFFKLTGDIRDMIYKQKTSSQLREKAVENGMNSLRRDGMMKVCRGQTTVGEVLRVTQT